MFVLCELEYFFDKEQDGSMCRVSRPLQIFKTREDAEIAHELFGPFYNFNLGVVAADDLDTEFR